MNKNASLSARTFSSSTKHDHPQICTPTSTLIIYKFSDRTKMLRHSVQDLHFQNFNNQDWTLYPGSLSHHEASTMKYEDPESLPDVASPATQRVYVDADGGRERCPVTRNTMICGDGEIATVAVECVGGISGDRNDTSKAVFEVIYNGMACIAKCWAPEGFEK